MSNNPVRLQSGDGIPITQTDNALDVNIAGGASALPMGAATSAKQDTGNTSLSTIKEDIALMKADLAAILAILEG